MLEDALRTKVPEFTVLAIIDMAAYCPLRSITATLSLLSWSPALVGIRSRKVIHLLAFPTWNINVLNHYFTNGKSVLRPIL